MSSHIINEKLDKEPLIIITDADVEGGRSCRCRSRKRSAIRSLACFLLLVIFSAMFLAIVNMPWCTRMGPHNKAMSAEDRPSKLYSVVHHGLPDAHGVRGTSVVQIDTSKRD